MSTTTIRPLVISNLACLSIALVAPSVANAQSWSMYTANLGSLNGSGSSGTATVEVKGNEATVKLRTSNASGNVPHAQHIHIGGNNVCPSANADADNDGFTTSAEGQPSYGEVKVSLTTSGATGGDSALAVDRFPKADTSGIVEYSRTFTLPEGVSADDVKNGVIVQHGISELFEDKAAYDGEKKSTLDPDLPLEATIPSTCGKLMQAPRGGVATGEGATSIGSPLQSLYALILGYFATLAN